jgi:SAM-dependent methyltransferase
VDRREQWDSNYAPGAFAPWDSGRPDEHLVGLVSGWRPGRALEIGCGTGTNAIWLAQQGYVVTAIDIAPRAVAKAHERVVEAGVAVDVRVVDFLAEDVPGGPFDFVFDRGCFHVFDAAAERARFAERVAGLLAPGGRWLSLVGSTEGPARDMGPPRRTLRDLADAVEPVLEALEIARVPFDLQGLGDALAWRCLWGRRDVPAQPSTTRH